MYKQNVCVLFVQILMSGVDHQTLDLRLLLFFLDLHQHPHICLAKLYTINVISAMLRWLKQLQNKQNNQADTNLSRQSVNPLFYKSSMHEWSVPIFLF